MIKELLIVMIIVLAFPVGYLLAYLCKDELVSGRRWFMGLLSLGLVLGIFFLFFNLSIALTLIFVFIVSFISLKKSYDKKFVKENI